MRTQESKADYFVVRVYRQNSADTKAPGLTGLVETAAGERHAFHNIEELWQILRQNDHGSHR